MCIRERERERKMPWEATTAAESPIDWNSCTSIAIAELPKSSFTSTQFLSHKEHNHTQTDPSTKGNMEGRQSRGYRGCQSAATRDTA